ncbi:hypothetical protein Q5752_002626 [Cryptotrichosporon argae]
MSRMSSSPGPSTPPRRASAHTTSPLDPVSPWPPPRAAPSSPSAPPAPTLPSAKEVYGALAALLTYITFGAYLFWALCPAAWLESVGWSWFPAQEWAVIVPCYTVVVVLLTYFSYAALMAYLTPAWTSPTIMTVDSDKPLEWFARFAEPDAIPQAVDMPIDLVNRVLYPARPRPSALHELVQNSQAH